MSWQSTLSWEDAKQRAVILQQIRQFFNDRNVLEVETPALSQGTITDVHLDALNCKYNFLKNSSDQYSTNLYLQTSPEFHMKRLLASGYGCIFQIAKAFRHEEAGRYHNPEFTMLEWYRIGFDHIDLMDEVSELLELILNCPEPTRITYQDLFKHNVNIDPLVATRESLIILIDSHNKLSDWLVDDANNDKSNDILLQFIFSEIIEQKIGLKAPIFVYNFPKSQASLAKICDKDTRVAQRFECYYQNVELVNGFNELTDSKLQTLRFQEDNNKRQRKNTKEKPIDYRFIQALEKGIPPCAGVALGIDRLVMLALNKKEIKEVISFPIDTA